MVAHLPFQSWFSTGVFTNQFSTIFCSVHCLKNVFTVPNPMSILYSASNQYWRLCNHCDLSFFWFFWRNIFLKFFNLFSIQWRDGLSWCVENDVKRYRIDFHKMIKMECFFHISTLLHKLILLKLTFSEIATNQVSVTSYYCYGMIHLTLTQNILQHVAWLANAFRIGHSFSSVKRIWNQPWTNKLNTTSPPRVLIAC